MEGSLQPTITLADGYEIPRIGLGTYLLRDGSQVLQAVTTALEAGYRHFDTASMYGNEAGIGKNPRS